MQWNFGNNTIQQAQYGLFPAPTCYGLAAYGKTGVMDIDLNEAV